MAKAKAFDKFINKPVKGAKIKEAFRQEKKAAIREKREAIEKRFEEKRQQKQAQYEARQQGGNSRGPISRNSSPDRSQGPRAKPGGSTTGKKWEKRDTRSGDTERKPYRKEDNQRSGNEGPQQRPASRPQTGSERAKPQNRPASGTTPQRSTGYKKDESRSSAQPRSPKPAPFNNPRNISDQSRNPTYGKPVNNDRRQVPDENRQKASGKDQKPSYKPTAAKRKPVTNDKPRAAEDKRPIGISRKPEPKRSGNDEELKQAIPAANDRLTPDQPQIAGNRPAIVVDKPETDSAAKKTPGRIPPSIRYQPAAEKKVMGPGKKTSFTKAAPAKEQAVTDNMPLNKFLAHAGICSRRDAAEKVRQGLATVNGQVITEPAFKVTDKDLVTFNGEKVHRSRNQVYILLNKPKDCITTSEDPQGRMTVMDIIRPATQERVYPVGRLDRNTSGVLLLTNDGDLAQQLSHPSYEVRKIYEVKLDKPLAKHDFDKILNGITLEDGETHADSLAYSDNKDRSIIGIEIHSGRNRIVRRMFEHLGYDVRGLDRVMYANLTKKNVERGHWRLLSEKEVRLLKYFNKSKKKAEPTS